jgi:hypothetical protein
MWEGGQRHDPAALPPGKTSYLLYMRLGGPQGRSGRVKKILPPPPGFDPRTVQPIASHYTDWATGPTSTINTITWWWDPNVLKFKSPPRSTGGHQASVPLHFPAHLPAGPMFSGWVILSRVPSRSAQLEFQFHQIFEKLKSLMRLACCDGGDDW